MSDIDLGKLRAHFPEEIVGKLPKITCSQCSKGSCGEGHKKATCPVCKAWISERHIHIDYIGHADVTDRILDVDPEWAWEPQATDPDPASLKAAIDSGNPEIVRMVIKNAPPKFERAANGNPVGLWIWLTIGGATKAGVGSCPVSQMDAEKVLIGDALRNAAMRFGVGTYLWAKGDRQDPAAENPTGAGGRAEPHARKAEQPRGQVARPGPKPAAEEPKPDLGDWGVRIDSLDSDEDVMSAKAELNEAHRTGRIPAAKANLIWEAMKARRAAIVARQGQPA